MKKRVVMMAVAVIVAVAVIMGVFLGCSGDSYTKYLPASSKVLVRVQMDEVMQESGLTAEVIDEKLPEGMSVAGMGVDFSVPAYVFMDDGGYTGILLSLSDKDLLIEGLDRVKDKWHVAPVEQQQGLSWTTVGDNQLAVFDDEALMLVGPVVPSAMAEVRQQVFSYFKQDKEESVLDKPLYKCLDKQQGMISVATDMDVFPQYPELIQLLNGAPDIQNLVNDMKLGGSFQSEPGRLVMHWEVFADNKILEKFETLGDGIDGRFLSKVPENVWMWAGGHVQGEKLMEILKDIPLVNMGLMTANHIMDVEQILKHIDGDFSCSVASDHILGIGSRGLSDMRLPRVTLLAKMKNKDFMNEADYWIQEARKNSQYSIEKRADSSYDLRIPPFNLNFGVEGQDFYMTSDPDFKKGGKSHGMAAYEKDIKDSHFFMWLRVTSFMELYRQIGIDEKEMSLIEPIEAVGVRVGEHAKSDVILYLKDKESGLKQLVDKWSELI